MKSKLTLKKIKKRMRVRIILKNNKKIMNKIKHEAIFFNLTFTFY